MSCANQLTGSGRGDAFKTGPVPGSIAKTEATGRKTAATGRKKQPATATGRLQAAQDCSYVYAYRCIQAVSMRSTMVRLQLRACTGRKQHLPVGTGRKQHKTAATGRKPRKCQLEPAMCTACDQEHPKEDLSQWNRSSGSDMRHIYCTCTCTCAVQVAPARRQNVIMIHKWFALAVLVPPAPCYRNAAGWRGLAMRRLVKALRSGDGTSTRAAARPRPSAIFGTRGS